MGKATLNTFTELISKYFNPQILRNITLKVDIFHTKGKGEWGKKVISRTLVFVKCLRHVRRKYRDYPQVYELLNDS